MHNTILDALSESANQGKTVVQLQLWSQDASQAICQSADFFRGTFHGIPVVFMGRETLRPERDFTLIYQ